MKLVMQGDRLRPLLENAAALAPGTGKRPSLECTRLSVEADGSVVVAASNTKESIRLKSTAHKWQEGSVFLPSENLLRLVKAAKSELVTISWNGTQPNFTVNSRKAEQVEREVEREATRAAQELRSLQDARRR